ncbi:hypothetical protein [Reyranella sp.]|uniref:hypothetical protein n=1 Tax=Reyranella sp. TaxID=1929291 RepID=UPI003BACB2E3
MKPPPPPGPPDIGDLRELVEQWARFTADLAENGYSFDLDNWLNDVDVRELVLEALPMFGREEMGELGLALEQADRTFMAATRAFRKCVWGTATAARERWTPEKNWWYFRTPHRSNGPLEDELGRIR